MPVKNKQIQVTSDFNIANNKLINVADPILSLDAVNKRYIDNFKEDISTFAILNKNMIASVTVNDGDLATSSAILETVKSTVNVAVNGNDANVGPGLDCYFKNADAPFEIRQLGEEQVGDKLYWNGSIAEYQLTSADLIDFWYLTSDIVIKGLASVTTYATSNITQTTVDFSAEVTDDGDAAVTERGFVYSTISNPTTADTKIASGTGIGTFNESITGLTEDTTYYVRAYAINAEGTSYGNNVSFMTTVVVALATVSSLASVAISDTIARNTSDVTSDGGTPVTEKGLAISTSTNPDINSDIIIMSDLTGVGIFDEYITNLAEDTTYYIRAYAENSIGIAYSNEQVFTMPIITSPATVVTDDPSTITETTAIFNGEITDSGNATITERGFIYSTEPNPTVDNTKVTSGNGTGTFNETITGLTDGTIYYYRAYAINAHSTSYGDDKTAVTIDILTNLASVSTDSPTLITETTATFNGEVLADGGATVTEKGFVYSTTPDPTTDNTTVISGTGTGTFSEAITGLTDGTIYYYRAYAINSNGTAYGDDKTAITIDIPITPAVVTLTTTNIYNDEATFSGGVNSNGGATITEKGFVYSTSINPTTSDNKVTLADVNDAFVYTVNSLSYNTQYYVRAYAINSVGTSYGGNTSFTSDELTIPPTVTTTPITGETAVAATTGGTVTDDGNSTLLERGVVYSVSTISTTPTVDDNKLADDVTVVGSYVSTLSSLVADTTYYVRAYAINAEGIAYGTSIPFSTNNNPLLPVALSVSATSVTTTTATCNCTQVSSILGVQERGVEYKTAQTDWTTVAGTGTANESYTVNLTGLVANTDHIFRAYVFNGNLTGYGTEIEFNTNSLGIPSAPTVTTSSTISDISVTSAAVSGTVVSDGGTTVTERGIAYGTSSNPNINDSIVTVGSGVGTFIAYLSYLSGDTTYYFRAYAINQAGTSYGAQQTFDTLPIPIAPTVRSYIIDAITSSSASCGGIVDSDGGSAVTERGIVYSTSPNPTTSGNKVTSGTGTGSYSASLTGLSFSTVYYTKAYAINGQGTSYGVQHSFTTKTIYSKPTVQSYIISGITTSSASCGGIVDSDGGATVTERGIVYSTSSNPTTSGNKVTSGTGTGNFSASLTGLSDNTIYYTKAYAINSQGTSYGAQKTFTTLTNIIYNYGFYYNAPVYMNSNFAPAGWRVPNVTDYRTLKTYLEPNEGIKIKSTTLWYDNDDNSNSSGFGGMPCGTRIPVDFDGADGFSGAIYSASFATQNFIYPGTAETSVHTARLHYSYDYLNVSDDNDVTYSVLIYEGVPVRFIKENSTDPGTVSDYDGNVYDTVKIGNQVWTATNWKCTKFNNGTSILYCITAEDWADCVYSDTPGYSYLDNDPKYI